MAGSSPVWSTILTTKKILGTKKRQKCLFLCYYFLMVKSRFNIQLFNRITSSLLLLVSFSTVITALIMDTGSCRQTACGMMGCWNACPWWPLQLVLFLGIPSLIFGVSGLLVGQFAKNDKIIVRLYFWLIPVIVVLMLVSVKTFLLI